jgi:hypothetical protein
MDYTDIALRDRISKKFADLGIDGRIDLLLMHYADNKYKSSTTEEQQQILEYIFSGYYPRLIEDDGQSHIEDIIARQYHEEHDYKIETLSIMVEEKLVTSFIKMGCVAYFPTALGHRINERGGWIKHVKREERDKSLVVKASKTSIAAAVSTFLILIFTSIVTYVDTNVHKKELNMQEKIFLQDSIQHKTQQDKEDVYQRNFDSLYREVDKLEHKLSPIKRQETKKK